MPSPPPTIQRFCLSGLLLGLIMAPPIVEDTVAQEQEQEEPQPTEESGQEADPPAPDQQAPDEQPPDEQATEEQAPEEPDKETVEQVKPLYTLVNEAMKSAAAGASVWKVDPSGEQPSEAGTTSTKATFAADFVRTPDNQVYMPFRIALDSQSFSSPAVAVYVRAVEKGQAAPPTAEADADEGPDEEDSDQEQPTGETKFPFEDFYTGTLKAQAPNEPTLLTGYAQLPAGAYDLYVAVRERASDPAQPFQATVVKEALDVPNYAGGELTTSSVLLVKQIQQLPQQPTPEQQRENPYTFGQNQLVIAPDGEFATTDEFNLLFFVYNFGKDQKQRPDLTVEYQLFHKAGEAEKEFRKIEPQTYNAESVDSDTDMLPVSLSFAASALEAGDFRLVIKVTDNTSGKSLTRDAPFKVVAS